MGVGCVGSVGKAIQATRKDETLSLETDSQNPPDTNENIKKMQSIFSAV
jgi:hypothetical protein